MVKRYPKDVSNLSSAAIERRESSVRRTVIFICLAISAILMTAGHYFIIASGAKFDQKYGGWYDPTTRWVSDFAAKWPEGLWIKSSIVIFCVALYLLFGLIITSVTSRRFSHLVKLYWLFLATGTISGLLLVVLFDMSTPQYVSSGPNIIQWLLGQRQILTEIRPDKIEWTKRGYHMLGFVMFVQCFIISAITLGFAEWYNGLRENFATSVFLIVMAISCASWLYSERFGLAGVPQRVLLLLIFFWVWRNVDTVRRIGKCK